MNKIAVKVRKGLLKSMTWTFPVSAYLWAIGVVLTGILYMIDPASAPPPDIPLTSDFIWGIGLAIVGLSMLYAMLVEHGRVVSILSFIIAMFATTLFLASFMDDRPVAMVSSGLTATYYSYSYLCSHLITEWRSIDEERLERLHDELDI